MSSYFALDQARVGVGLDHSQRTDLEKKKVNKRTQSSKLRNVVINLVTNGMRINYSERPDWKEDSSRSELVGF